MKARETIVLALIISLALVPILASVPVRAQGQYTERLDVYTAGSNAFWLMTMNRVNSTLPNLASAEATSGLTSYRLLAVSTQAAVSDFQTFGVDGYNVLDVPSLPSQGLFLTVNASSSSAASPIVSYFATRFGTTFTLVSTGPASSVYFAPVNFVGAAAPVLYRLVPTTMKGFATFLTESSFTGLAIPVIALSGSNNGSGFSHSITIGSAASGILSTSGAINVPKILSNANGTLTASPSSSSSEVVIHSLDGVIQSTDGKATVSNDISNLSGTYTLSAGQGAKVHVNATILSQAPTAIAYREFDRGTLTTNQSLAVTIIVKDTTESGVIQNVTVNDNWWQKYPAVFKLESGNYNFTIASIAAGQNATESYALKILSASSMAITVPAATATFESLLSTTSYRSQLALNQALLQINNVGPAITIVARPTISSGAPLGTPGNYTLTVTNSGNSPALDVKVGSYSLTNLAQGGSQTINVPISLTSLQQRNFTKTFSVEFTDAAQQTQNVSSNSVSLLLSHSGMVLPFIQLSTNDTLSASSIASRSLNVTYSFANKGSANSSAVTGTQAFPTGVSCKLVAGKGACTAGTYTMTVPGLTTQNTQVNKLELNFTQDNLIIQPATITTSYEGATLHTFGGAYVIPAGIVLTKSFSLKTGFPGMTSSVSLGMTNAGSNPVTNATLSSTQDIFDSLPGGATTTMTYATLAPQQRQSFNYTVTLESGSSGNASSSPATVSLIVGGLSTGFSSAPAYVQVFKPVTVAVITSPSTPEENHDFTMTIVFKNTASVGVTDAIYTFTIPAGLTVVSGAQVAGKTVTVSVPSIGPDSNQTVVVTLSASTGVTIDTTSSHLGYHYQGFTLTGLAPKQTVTVSVDATTRYTLPIIIAVAIALAGIVYVRRRINPAVQT